MKKYEIMMIIRPTLGEEEVKKVAIDFEKILTSNDAKVIDKKDLGQKELAYEIKDFKTGFYYLFNVETKNEKAVKEFDRLALINKDVVRHLITRKED